MKSDDDPQILVKKFSLKMQKIRKLDKVAKIAILLLSIVRAVVKVLYLKLFLSSIDYNDSGPIPWTLSILNWITAIFFLTILIMFFWSLKTIKLLSRGMEQ